jgi:hypothetical protein
MLLFIYTPDKTTFRSEVNDADIAPETNPKIIAAFSKSPQAVEAK